MNAIETHAIERGLSLAGTPTLALEVGCEGGRWSRLLADRGWSVVCTDVNPTSLRRCQERVSEAQCHLVKPSDTTLPCATGTVGLLLCVEVFPVIGSPWLPAEASRVLSDAGLFIGVVLNRRSLRGAFVQARARVRQQQDAIAEQGWYTHSYSAWKQTMQQHSLEMVYERGFCWFPFPRASNSRLVPVCTQLEHALGLRALPHLSPWVVCIARKTTTPHA